MVAPMESPVGLDEQGLWLLISDVIEFLAAHDATTDEQVMAWNADERLEELIPHLRDLAGMAPLGRWDAEHFEAAIERLTPRPATDAPEFGAVSCTSGPASAHQRPDGSINLFVLPAAGGVTGATLTREEAQAVVAVLTRVLG